MITQDRTITIGEYRFEEGKHIHQLFKDGEWKNMYGTTTVLKVINKDFLMQWAADLAAIEALEAERCPGIKAEYEEIQKETDWYKKSALLKELDKKYPQYKQARTAHTKKKEAAGELGTIVHSLIEEHINNYIELGYHPTLSPAQEKLEQVIKFADWALMNNVKFLASEKHLYSKEWFVAGITDFICEIDGKRFIGDIKTSKGIYPEHLVQCSAYAKMAEEMGMDKFDGVVIVNLKKDGGFDTRMFFDIPQGIKVFESALTIHKFQESQKINK